MVIRLKAADAVIIGIGWTGSILARELTKAGLNVVGLERGKMRLPETDFALPQIRDELKYAVRQELVQDPALETITMRHEPGENALPFRRFGAFMPGMGLGGAGTIWNGMTWRFLPFDHQLRSRIAARYGKNAIPDDMTIADWAMSYDELEPSYDRFEKLYGTSGKAGNLRGTLIEGGNISEGPRQWEYPNPPLIQSRAGEMFEKAAKSLGYHPYPTPSANLSAEYTNPEGATTSTRRSFAGIAIALAAPRIRRRARTRRSFRCCSAILASTCARRASISGSPSWCTTGKRAK